MANINDIMLQASELQPGISRLLRNSTYPRYDDLSGLEINYEDGEQLFLLDELRGVMEKLADVEDCIRYIAQPVLRPSGCGKTLRAGMKPTVVTTAAAVPSRPW